MGSKGTELRGSPGDACLTKRRWRFRGGVERLF